MAQHLASSPLFHGAMMLRIIVCLATSLHSALFKAGVTGMSAACRAPDTAPVKAKMQHASTKDLFRSMLEGIAVEMNATEKGDLSEATLREKVKTTVAKK